MSWWYQPALTVQQFPQSRMLPRDIPSLSLWWAAVVLLPYDGLVLILNLEGPRASLELSYPTDSRRHSTTVNKSANSTTGRDSDLCDTHRETIE